MGWFFRFLWWIDHTVSKGLLFTYYETDKCYYLGNILPLLSGGLLVAFISLLTDIFAHPHIKAMWNEQKKRRQTKLKEIIRKGEDSIRWWN